MRAARVLSNLYRSIWGAVVGPVEAYVDTLTMYHVVQFGLTGLVAWALASAAVGIAPFSFATLLIHSIVIIAVSVAVHMLLVKVFDAPANIVSTFITSYILILTITPSLVALDLAVAAVASATAVIGKYAFVYRHRHIFNPAALALFLISIFGYTTAGWWVGSAFMFPIMLLVFFFLFLKTRKFEMQLAYILVSSVCVCIVAWDSSWASALYTHFFSWPTLFLAAVMLVEPLGMPGDRKHQLIFASIVAVLASVPYAVPPLYGTPEFALLVGNLYTLVVFWPERHVLSLVRKNASEGGVVEYIFSPWNKLHVPGQYAEWTLQHEQPDYRGERRLFSISSAAGGNEISFAVRHLDNGSTFKRALKELEPGARMYLTSVAGDFTLGDGPAVLVAGGIGITPFLSVLRSAAHDGKKLNAILFYCNNSIDTAAFRDEVRQLCEVADVQLVEVIKDAVESDGTESGYFRAELVKKYVNDIAAGTYYLSGPPSMVGASEDVVRELGVPSSKIVTDYFPGLV